MAGETLLLPMVVVLSEKRSDDVAGGSSNPVTALAQL